MGTTDSKAVATHVVTTGDESSQSPTATRLDSWKEIAHYLNRSVRTVQRWERAEEK
jgi:DNA-binding transcriptional regulator YiaG